MSTVSPSRHEAEDDQKDECKQDQNSKNIMSNRKDPNIFRQNALTYQSN